MLLVDARCTRLNGFKVENISEGATTLLRLSGRIEADHIPQLQAEIEAHTRVTCLDLGQVKLLSREVVTFLVACERQGIELRNCPTYVREWITGEQNL